MAKVDSWKIVRVYENGKKVGYVFHGVKVSEAKVGYCIARKYRDDATMNAAIEAVRLSLPGHDLVFDPNGKNEIDETVEELLAWDGNDIYDT